MFSFRRAGAWCLGGVSSVLLFAVILASPVQSAEEVIYWWDYGEVDEEHVTRAAVADRKIVREGAAEIRTTVGRRVFVGDEPIRILYDLYLPFDMRVDKESLRQKMAPFEIVALQAGRRTPEAGDRYRTVQRVTLTVRLPDSFGYGAHRLPAFRIIYDRESPRENGGMSGRGELEAEPMDLEKVPLYVEVSREHTVGLIGDPIPVVLEIHGDGRSQVLNEYPAGTERPSLSIAGHETEKPAVILSRERTEYPASHYSVIRWRFMVSLQERGVEAFQFALPEVVWRPVDGKTAEPASTSSPEGADESLRRIVPDPIDIVVRDLAGEGQGYMPMKGIRPVSGGERRLLMVLPLTVLSVLVGIAVVWGVHETIRRAGNRREKGERPKMKERGTPPDREYDRRFWDRILVSRRLFRARKNYLLDPSQENCISMRVLLARRAAMRLDRDRRVSVQEVCAMTASELEALTGESFETRIIRELDRQLEEAHYRGIQ